MRIMSILPIYGGAAHDSFVWNHSHERDYLETKWLDGNDNFWLLGKIETLETFVPMLNSYLFFR